MSLKGAKLIWLNKKDKQDKIIKLKNQKKFKFGYYMTSDFILENSEAKSVHCEIVADAFNRINIVNNSKQNPIFLNGFPVKIRRPLFHGNKIKIFDQEFIWQFPKNGKGKSSELAERKEKLKEADSKDYKTRTPVKQNENIPAPNSEPWKIKNKRRIKERLSAHSLMQCERESTDESETEIENKVENVNTNAVKVDQRNSKTKFSIRRSTLTEQLRTRRTFDCVTPIKISDPNASLMNFDVTLKKKENTPKNRLQLCKSSGTLVTSFSPQNTSLKSNSSFAYIKSNKNTPKSVYGTPKSVLSEVNEMSSDLINFSTPKSKFIISNASMYLIDLTTPAQNKEIDLKSNVSNLQKTPIIVSETRSPILKSALKTFNTNTKSVKKVTMASDLSPQRDSVSKQIKITTTPYRKSKTFRSSISSNEVNVGKSSLRKEASSIISKISTPKNEMPTHNNDSSEVWIDDGKNNNSRNSFSSIETINDTIDLNDISSSQKGIDSSIIELSDESVLGDLTLKEVSESNSKILSLTPQNQHQKTRQSLMKTAILSSARKISQNCQKKSLRLNTTSTPVHSKRLSLSFSSKIVSSEKSPISRRSIPKSSLSSTVLKTPLSKKKLLISNSLINSAPISKNQIIKPKRHSCINMSVKNLTEPKSFKKIENNFNNLINARRSIFNSSVRENLFSSLNNIKSSKSYLENPITNSISTTNEQIENVREQSLENEPNQIQTEISKNIEQNSQLNETFSIESDEEEYFESKQSHDNNFLSEDNMSNKISIKNQKIENEKNISEKKSISKKIIESNEKVPLLKEITEVTKTPKPIKALNMEGIEHFKNTPEYKESPTLKGRKNIYEKDLSNSTNIKNLSSPLLKLSKNKTDSNSLVGVKELLNSPKEINTSKFEGLKEMLKTPRISLKKMKGVKQLLNTSTNNFEEDEGFDSIFKTPSAKTVMVSDNACESTTTKKLLTLNNDNILKPAELTFEEDNICHNGDTLFDLQNLESDCRSTPHLTSDNTFDKLVGRHSIKKSYSSSKSKSKISAIPIVDINTNEDIAKSDVQEWVESIPLPDKFDNAKTISTSMNLSGVENNSLNLKFKKNNINSLNLSGIKVLNTTCESIYSDYIPCSINESFDESLEEHINQSNLPSLSPILQKSKSQSVAKDNILQKLRNSEKQIIELDQDFRNFANQPKFIVQKSYTPQGQKLTKRNTRRTEGNNQILESENFQNHQIFNVNNAIAPQLRKSNTRSTMENNHNLNKTFDLEETVKQEFKNFQEQPNIVGHKSFTPETHKPQTKISRRTMGANKVFDESFDLEAAKDKYEMEQAFKNFQEQPNIVAPKSFTPKMHKPQKRISRRTMGANKVFDESFDLVAAKDKYEMEQAFKNFQEQPNIVAQKSFTPKMHKPQTRISRKTMGANKVFDESFDLEAAKDNYEMEQAFKNFQEQPNIVAPKSFTPKMHKPQKRISRRTMGANKVFDESFDLVAAKDKYEMEQAFKNFQEQPNIVTQKSFTPETHKPQTRISRRTMGANKVFDESFDLETARNEYEMEQAFKNFQEQPNIVAQKSFTPKMHKTQTRISRKTMGANKVFDESFDLEAAKDNYEMEQAFKNFQEQPNIVTQKSFTPETHKPQKRISRRTMGANKVFDESFDLEAAKDNYEMEQAFKNFQEQPNIVTQKSFTPETHKPQTRISRRTMGANKVFDESFDLETARNEYEMEQAFKNFQEQPNIVAQKSFTPKMHKTQTRISRKTMGANKVFDESFDLEAAKDNYEMEQAFKNFQEQPNIVTQKSFTPETHKPQKRISRRTMGANKVFDESFDLEAAKDNYEMEQAFKNFQEQPNIVTQKSFTPETHKPQTRISRRTMGANKVFDESFDLEAAKDNYEMEQAFKNFQEQPNIVTQKSFTPETHKPQTRISRKTMGANKVFDESFDLETARNQYEMEQAFKNFQEQPNTVAQKYFTPEVQKPKTRNSRKTMGANQLFDESFDLETARNQYEMEQAFKNFQEQPNTVAQKSFTPEVQKPKTRNSRKTMGANLLFDESFDLETARNQYEMEQAFKNFQEQPNVVAQKSFTPEVQKLKTRNSRKTMGANQLFDESFDLETARNQYEMEQAFKNFQEQPNIVAQKSFTPEVQKPKTRNSRKTMGANQLFDESFDLETARNQYEMEQAFKNFQEQPNVVAQKSFTPEVQKLKTRNSRKTMGANQLFDESFDLETARNQYEMEQAFKNFQEQPNTVAQKSFTPEVQKPKTRNSRKTMGANQLFDESFDLETARNQYEMEQAFKNFQEQPNIVAQKSFTPEVQKPKTRNSRKTMGANQLFDESFDLETARNQYEMEQAFKNFQEEPNLKVHKSLTPELRILKVKICRKTLGNDQVVNKSFDLQTIKQKLEKQVQSKLQTKCLNDEFNSNNNDDVSGKMSEEKSIGTELKRGTRIRRNPKRVLEDNVINIRNQRRKISNDPNTKYAKGAENMTNINDSTKNFEGSEYFNETEINSPSIKNLMPTKNSKSVRFVNEESDQIINIIQEDVSKNIQTESINLSAVSITENVQRRSRRRQVNINQTQKDVIVSGLHNIRKGLIIEKESETDEPDKIETENQHNEKSVKRGRKKKQVLEDKMKTKQEIVQITENVVEDNSDHKIVDISIKITDEDNLLQAVKLNDSCTRDYCETSSETEQIERKIKTKSVRKNKRNDQNENLVNSENDEALNVNNKTKNSEYDESQLNQEETINIANPDEFRKVRRGRLVIKTNITKAIELPEIKTKKVNRNRKGNANNISDKEMFEPAVEALEEPIRTVNTTHIPISIESNVIESSESDETTNKNVEKNTSSEKIISQKDNAIEIPVVIKSTRSRRLPKLEISDSIEKKKSLNIFETGDALVFENKEKLNEIEEKHVVIAKSLPKRIGRSKKIESEINIGVEETNILKSVDTLLSNLEQSTINIESDNDSNNMSQKPRGRRGGKIKLEEKSESNENKTPEKRKGRQPRKVKLDEQESKQNVADIKEVELLTSTTFTKNKFINNLEKSEKNIDSDNDLNKTPPKTKQRRGRKPKLEIVDSKNTSTVTEPEFKTPSSVAPKARALRSLRSNSVSTPTMPDEENLTEKQVNGDKCNEVQMSSKVLLMPANEMPRRRLRSNSTVMTDIILSSENEFEDFAESEQKDGLTKLNTNEPVKQLMRRNKNVAQNEEKETEETKNPTNVKSTTLRAAKRKIQYTEDTSNDFDCGGVIIEKRSTRRRK